TKTLTALRSRRNFQANISFESRQFQLRPERRLPWRDLHFVNEIAALNGKVWMFRQSDAQKKVATFSAASAGFSLTGEPDSLTFVNAARNFHLIIFDFIGPGATKRNRAGRSVQSFFKRHQNIGFDIGSAFRRCFASAESAG